LACGVLLAAAGLALWDGLRHLPGLPRAVLVNRWLAGTLLSIGALLAWQRSHSPSAPALGLSRGAVEGPVPHLILMAALAAPPGTHLRRSTAWGDAARVLPALALAGVGLFWSPDSLGAGPGSPWHTLVQLGSVICAGFGARALGEALAEIGDSIPRTEWPSAVTHVLLTLLAGGTGLVSLWQRGSVWDGTAGQSGLAAAWLAWSAARLGPRQPPWLPAGLTVAAALLLIVLAAGY
jgi:hypothetical protein